MHDPPRYERWPQPNPRGTDLAYAAETIGSPDVINESLLSEDLKNNEVKTPDLAPGSVQTGKVANNQIFSEDVRDDTLANGGLTAGDLAGNSVGAAEVAPNSLAGAINEAGLEFPCEHGQAAAGGRRALLHPREGSGLLRGCGRRLRRFGDAPAE